MEELILETEKGNIPINQEIIEKYDLKKGVKSPFTRSRILGKNGDYFSEKTKEKELKELEESPEDDSMETRDGVKFTTAEILDISSGVDSST